MKAKKETVFTYMEDIVNKSGDASRSFTTMELSQQLHMQRTNVSTILNELVKDGMVEKQAGKPVKYFIKQKHALVKPMKSVFESLIGSEHSLKNAIQLAKAAIVYPEDRFHTLIIGEAGSGKSCFSYMMYEFAKEKNILSEDAPFIKFNCHYDIDHEDELLSHLYGDHISSHASAIEQAKHGVLMIDHVDALPPKAKQMLFEWMDRKEQHDLILICSIDEQPGVLTDVFYQKFSIHIELPSLAQRSLEERLELVERFFMDEAEKVKKAIKINSELLRCFLLYPCMGNIKQLQNDIKLGCANAYVREINQDSDILHVYIHDCHSYIRKGFIFYKENRDQIEALIPDNYTYTFTTDRAKKKEEMMIKRKPQTSIYTIIEQKVKELRKREIKEEDIMTIISADIEHDVMSVQHQLNNTEVDRTVLMKIVDPAIIDLVDDFLKSASKKFNKVYPLSTFCKICLHLSNALKQRNYSQNLSNEKIMEIIEHYQEEYSFSMAFITAVEREFDVHLPIDEVIFITIYLCENQIQHRRNKQPNILIVMHGTIASSIANAVNQIYRDQKVYAYDLLLDKAMDQAYEELSKLIKTIDHGAGILMIYDMGSIRSLCESIIQEMGIYAKMIEVPITIMALDCAIKLGTTGSIDDVYDDIMKHGFGSFGVLKNEYQRLEKENHPVIITLCHTGEGSALQIKQYLEKNLEEEEINIIALAVGDNKRLINEINDIMEAHKLLCIVGTYDPKLYNIPFISVAKLFDTPVDKLPMLLALKDMEVSSEFDYSAMYDYLEEQLPAVDLKKVKRHLPKALQKIKHCVPEFTINEEVGLFMHISCSINRMILQEPLPANLHKDSILKHHKRLYHDLKDILRPLEDAMAITFDDDEYATIIEILI